MRGRTEPKVIDGLGGLEPRSRRRQAQHIDRRIGHAQRITRVQDAVADQVAHVRDARNVGVDDCMLAADQDTGPGDA
jgi:hypothetical protein